jgi:UDP-N-acetylglucosamine diphosphorylase / glucose-1-phosphate thymidylyltransferase / UDP-N-acetylgalactosamine diphosphorylase / glucosamine-1-phosphate N-acetyltransferase / galactosamine-1-phosphate N-acetyltransferase
MQAVVVAAGESSRFWPLNNGIHKSQTKLLGKSLLYWTIRGLAENKITDVTVVVSKNSSAQSMLEEEEIQKLGGGMNMTYAVQEDPKGTGNALWQAKSFITEPFVLLWGNKVGSKELVAKMIAKQKEGADAVFVGSEVANPSEYGMLQLRGEKILGIVEKPEPGKEPSNIAVSGARLLTPDFFSYYEKLVDYHEVDLIDATNEYVKDKNAFVLLVDETAFTLKYPWDLFGIMDYLLSSDYFKPTIAGSANVARNVVIKGSVHIGEGTVVKDGTVLQGPLYIGDNCSIGYHTVLRGPIDMEAGCKTGAFMEIKHSIVQQETVFHSGYVGDSIIGKQSRFGAGFVTGNLRLDRKLIYGFEKLGLIAGENSVFGINSGTMPGIVVGSHCKVGPGTHVFEHLVDNSTLYSKPENIRK